MIWSRRIRASIENFLYASMLQEHIDHYNDLRVSNIDDLLRSQQFLQISLV